MSLEQWRCIARAAVTVLERWLVLHSYGKAGSEQERRPFPALAPKREWPRCSETHGSPRKAGRVSCYHVPESSRQDVCPLPYNQDSPAIMRLTRLLKQWTESPPRYAPKLERDEKHGAPVYASRARAMDRKPYKTGEA